MLFAKFWFGPKEAGVLGNRTSKGTEVRGQDLFKTPKTSFWLEWGMEKYEDGEQQSQILNQAKESGVSESSGDMITLV